MAAGAALSDPLGVSEKASERESKRESKVCRAETKTEGGGGGGYL